MALGLTEFSRQESLDQVPGEFRSNDAATQADDVHVIVFDALTGRKVIFDQGGANARYLIGANCRAHAAAADGDSAHNFSAGNRPGEGNHEIRIIVLRVQSEGSKIGYYMRCGAKPLRKNVF